MRPLVTPRSNRGAVKWSEHRRSPSAPLSSSNNIMSPDMLSPPALEPGLTSGDRESMYARRALVIREIIETETNYVADLKLLVKVFYIPLKIQDPSFGFSKSDLDSVFSNVEILLSINTQLLQALEQIVPTSTSVDGMVSISSAFLGIVDYLKTYSQYCTNQATALERLAELEKRKNIRDFLTRVSEEELHGLYLKDFLIKPVQRIWELLNFTPHDHPDYPGVLRTLNKVNEVAEAVNIYTAETQNFAKLMEFTQKVSGYENVIDVKSMRFVRDDWIMIFTGDLDLQMKLTDDLEKHVYLFSRAIVICKGDKSSAKKKAKESIRQVILLENILGNRVYDIQGHPAVALQTGGGGESQVVCNILFQTAAIRANWLENVEIASKSLREGTGKSTQLHIVSTERNEVDSSTSRPMKKFGTLNRQTITGLILSPRVSQDRSTSSDVSFAEAFPDLSNESVVCESVCSIRTSLDSTLVAAHLFLTEFNLGLVLKYHPIQLPLHEIYNVSTENKRVAVIHNEVTYWIKHLKSISLEYLGYTLRQAVDAATRSAESKLQPDYSTSRQEAWQGADLRSKFSSSTPELPSLHRSALSRSQPGLDSKRKSAQKPITITKGLDSSVDTSVSMQTELNQLQIRIKELEDQGTECTKKLQYYEKTIEILVARLEHHNIDSSLPSIED